MIRILRDSNFVFLAYQNDKKYSWDFLHYQNDKEEGFLKSPCHPYDLAWQRRGPSPDAP